MSKTKHGAQQWKIRGLTVISETGAYEQKPFSSQLQSATHYT